MIAKARQLISSLRLRRIRNRQPVAIMIITKGQSSRLW